MTCYGVDTARIERLTSLVDSMRRELRIDVDTDVLPLAQPHRTVFLEIAKAYLAAFVCFLEVIHSLMQTKRRFVIQRQAGATPRGVDLEGYAFIYSRATKNFELLLSRIFDEIFPGDPKRCAEFVTQMLASETAEEMKVWTRVQTAENEEEAQEHGEAAKQVVDSVKAFVRGFLDVLPFIRNRKERLDKVAHAVNEMLGIFFRTRA
jgi:hypothetical protein